jgi:hypothetical protein
MARQGSVPGLGGGQRSNSTPRASAPTGLPAAGNDEVFEDDFSNVELTGGMVPAGVYLCRVSGFQTSTSNAGNPQYEWELTVIHGPYTGQTMKFWTSRLPQARWKVAESLEAIGIAAQGTIARFRLSDVVGRPCLAEVKEETYQGVTRPKVQRLLPPPDNDTLNNLAQEHKAAGHEYDLPF